MKSGFIHISLLLLTIFLFFGCSKDQVPEPTPIATVGERVVDWKLLWRSYNLNPKWGRRLTRSQAFDNQLNYLIEQKLFAQAAQAEGIPPEIADHLDFIKEKEMIKALYMQEVAAYVEISDAEYQTAYARSKKKVKFEFIYTTDEHRARSYRMQLAKKSVNDMILADPVTEEKGITSMLGFGDMAVEVEEVVFDILPGEVAGPVKVGNKFMVVKMADGQVEKFVSKMDFAENKNKIHKIIFDRRARIISDDYIYRIMKDQEVKINPDAFFPLAKQFSEIVSARNTTKPATIYVNNNELKTTQANIKEISDYPLVSFKAGQLTIKQFLSSLLSMPGDIRPQVNMISQLRKAIGVAVRNHYLAQRAYRNRLDYSPSVQYETAIQCDEVLTGYWLKKIRNGITVTPQEIVAFRASGNFAKIQQQVSGELDPRKISDIIADYKFTKKRIYLADSLQRVFKIVVDTTLLKSHIEEPDKFIDEQPIGFTYQEMFR